MIAATIIDIYIFNINITSYINIPRVPDMCPSNLALKITVSRFIYFLIYFIYLFIVKIEIAN